METLAPYQQKNCPFCLANLPHAKHVTALDVVRLGITIGTTETVCLEADEPSARADEGLYETPEGDWDAVPTPDYRDDRREALVNALALAGGRVVQTAELLGYSETHVRRMMKKYGLVATRSLRATVDETIVPAA